MITSNDLFDIYFSFLLIRNDIKYELNSLILDAIENTIKDKNNGDNSVRKKISMIDNLDTTVWNFVFCNNLYTYREIINDTKTLNMICYLCNLLKRCLVAKCFEQAYDFVDVIHFVPIYICKNNGIISIKVIRKITKEYQKKWGKINFNILSSI